MPEPVTAKQQSALCISGRYSACPRLDEGVSARPGSAAHRSRDTVRLPGLSSVPAFLRGRKPILVIFAAAAVLVVMAFMMSGVISVGEAPAAGQHKDSALPTETPLAVAGVVPAPPPIATAPATPVPSPTGQSVATSGSASSSSGPQGTSTATPTPARAPTVSSGQGSYVVVAGDTLWGIAQRYGVSVEKLMQANGLTDRSYVRSGLRLVIPER